MQTVIETAAYLAAARAAGLDAGEMAAIVSIVSAAPESGDVMAGTGGCRKLRFARGGRGKSGGVRVITFFTGPDIPVFLITVFAKNERANLSKAERNALGVLTRTLADTYRAGQERKRR